MYTNLITPNQISCDGPEKTKILDGAHRISGRNKPFFFSLNFFLGGSHGSERFGGSLAGKELHDALGGDEGEVGGDGVTFLGGAPNGLVVLL